MTTQEVISIVDAHRQKYSDSCSPSLCEMLLKLSEAVDSSYYDEQDRDKNNPVGLDNIRNKTIHGRTFRRFDSKATQTPLVDKIQQELSRGKFLGIFLPIGTVHGFVIAAMDSYHILLLSKYSEDGKGSGLITTRHLLPVADAHNLERFDCIYYEDY
jgi:hypothetical protein